jgi:photosystem II stability/assembly factor-like uncharacterized protein
MFTLNGSRGWVATVSRNGSRVTVATTADGGRGWRDARLPVTLRDGVGGPISVSFVNHRSGWLSVVTAHGSGFAGSLLWRSSDGGVQWFPLGSHRFMAGPIAFNGLGTGWALGGPTSDSLFRTRDGGQTWHRSRIPTPKGLRTEERVVALPEFISSRAGVLEQTFSESTAERVVSTTLVFSITRDGGRSWTPTTPLSARAFTGYHSVGVPADVVSGEDWVVGSPSGLYQTSDRGRTWSLQLPDVSFDTVAQVDFASTKVGWVLVTDGRCPPGKAICGAAPRLFRTVDGGVHWVRDDPGLGP